MTGYRVSLSGAQMASSDLTNAWSGVMLSGEGAMGALRYVAPMARVQCHRRPLKLIVRWPRLAS